MITDKSIPKTEWEEYYRELEAHEKYYDAIKPDENDKKAFGEWQFAKWMNKPNKPGYVVANND